MKDILTQIIRDKANEVKHIKLEEVKALARSVGPNRRSVRSALEASSSGIIAEFKRRSPSKGWISAEALAEVIVPAYAAAGASACSILTDETYFGGNSQDLKKARTACPNLPLLRKDFILSEAQVYEAKALGADAILLIAACLSTTQCRELSELAHELRLEILLEIHSEEELTHLNPMVDLLGVNNRHLGSFHTDIQNSFRLAGKLMETPEHPCLISESGLSSGSTIRELRAAGFQGFLIGESLMKTSDPGLSLTQLIASI